MSVVHSEGLSIPTDIDQLELVLTDSSEGATSAPLYDSGTILLCHDTLTTNCQSLPITLTLVPGPHRPGDSMRLEVDARLGTQKKIADAAVFTFRTGASEELDFVLSPSCIDTDCEASNQTCGADGTCVAIEPTPLHGTPDLAIESMVDANVAVDMGPTQDLTGPSNVDGASDLTMASPDLLPGMSTCGNALFTDVSTSAITAPMKSAYDPTGSFAIEAWVRPTARPVAGLATIMSHEINQATERSIAFGIDQNGYLSFHFSPDGTAESTTTSSDVVPLNTWSHVAAEFNGSNNAIFVYINGVHYPDGNSNAAKVNATTTPLVIGNSADGSQPFIGAIDELRWSSTARYPDNANFNPQGRYTSDANTIALYHFDDLGTTATDVSPLANDGTLGVGVSYAAGCVPNICSYVHSEGQGYVDVAAPSPDNLFTPAHSFTVDGWFRNLAGNGSVVAHGGSYGFGVGNPSNKLSFNVTCLSGQNYTVTAPTQLTNRLWWHWAGVFDAVGQIATLYINGVSVGSISAPCSTSATTTAGFDAGSSGSVDMSQLRLSSVVRYTGTFSPEVSPAVDTNTIALYRFDEGSGIVAHDSSSNALNAGLNGQMTQVYFSATCP